MSATASDDESDRDGRKVTSIKSLPTAVVASIFRSLDLETHSRLRRTHATIATPRDSRARTRRLLWRQLRNAPSQNPRPCDFTARRPTHVEVDLRNVAEKCVASDGLVDSPSEAALEPRRPTSRRGGARAFRHLTRLEAFEQGDAQSDTLDGAVCALVWALPTLTALSFGGIPWASVRALDTCRRLRSLHIAPPTGAPLHDIMAAVVDMMPTLDVLAHLHLGDSFATVYIESTGGSGGGGGVNLFAFGRNRSVPYMPVHSLCTLLNKTPNLVALSGVRIQPCALDELARALKAYSDPRPQPVECDGVSGEAGVVFLLKIFRASLRFLRVVGLHVNAPLYARDEQVPDAVARRLSPCAALEALELDAVYDDEQLHRTLTFFFGDASARTFPAPTQLRLTRCHHISVATRHAARHAYRHRVRLADFLSVGAPRIRPRPAPAHFFFAVVGARRRRSLRVSVRRSG